jgi:hypothetical protein
MRIRLKGINSVRKRLADGSTKTFYYAWKGGPPLRGAPGTPEFVASYNEAVARKREVPRGSLLSILQQYQQSDAFQGLAASTRRSYVALIQRIEQRFSDFPLAALSDPRTRGVFIAIRRLARALFGSSKREQNLPTERPTGARCSGRTAGKSVVGQWWAHKDSNLGPAD